MHISKVLFKAAIFSINKHYERLAFVYAKKTLYVYNKFFCLCKRLFVYADRLLFMSIGIRLCGSTIFCANMHLFIWLFVYANRFLCKLIFVYADRHLFKRLHIFYANILLFILSLLAYSPDNKVLYIYFS